MTEGTELYEHQCGILFFKHRFNFAQYTPHSIRQIPIK